MMKTILSEADVARYEVVASKTPTKLLGINLFNKVYSYTRAGLEGLKYRGE